MLKVYQPENPFFARRCSAITRKRRLNGSRTTRLRWVRRYGGHRVGEIPPRNQAVENYEKTVMPAVEQIIDDHIYFIRGQSTDWEQKIEDADKDASNQSALRRN